MKILFLLLAFSTFSFAQNGNAKTVSSNQPACTFEMTAKQLTSKELKFKCSEVYENRSFRIENFKIKFRGNPSLLISGQALNDEALEIAQNLKAGDHFYIFDIENITIGKANNQDFQSLKGQIID